MPSKVANAVGVAQQYMPQEKETYKARLQGVQLNWNVTPEYDNTTGKTAQALEALGVRLGGNELENEKFNYEYANLYARQLYNQLSDKDKKTLTAQQMVTFYGSYKLADNKYATAIIDEMRGEQLNLEAHKSYLEWRKNQPLLASEDEEANRYEQYMKDYQDKQFAENNNVIMNMHAFMNGYTKRTLEQRSQVSNIYYEVKEHEQVQIRNHGLISDLTEVSRDRNYSDLDINGWQELYTPIMNKWYSTNRMATDPDGEVKFLESMYKTVATQSGSRVALDALGEMVLPDGRKIKEIIKPQAYYDMANQSANNFKTGEALKMDDWFNGFSNAEALKEGFKKLQKENPEQARMYAPYYDKWVNKKEQEDRIRRYRESKLLGQSFSAEVQISKANEYIKSMLDGYYTGTGATEKDLAELGVSMDMLSQVLMERMPEMTGDQVAIIMNQPIAGGISKWFDQYLPVALQSGTMSPALERALQIARSSGKYSNLALGKYAGKVKKLQFYIDRYGEEAGMQGFVQAEDRLRDPEASRQLTNAYDGLYGNPKATMYSISSDTHVDVELTASNTPPEVLGRIKEFAIDLMSGGSSAEEARKTAINEIMKEFVCYDKDLFISTAYHNQVINDSTPYTEALFDRWITQTKDSMGAGCTVSFGSDGGGEYIAFKNYNNNPPIVKKYVDNAKNDMQYYIDQGTDPNERVQVKRWWQ